MATLLVAERIAAASSALALRTVRSSTTALAPAWTWPNAPNMTLVNERFMALHMITERMKPEEPSRAPATTRTLLLSTNPRRAADRPAYELRSEMTVGMSAPPIGVTSKIPNNNATPTMAGKRCTYSGWIVRTIASTIAAPRTERLTMFCPRYVI